MRPSGCFTCMRPTPIEEAIEEALMLERSPALEYARGIGGAPLPYGIGMPMG